MEDFRFTHLYRVGIVDINYGGQVSNAAVLNYFQEARVRYPAEMFQGDELLLGMRTEAFGRTSFRLEHCIEGARGVTAEGETALAAFDCAVRKPRWAPQGLCAAAAHFGGRNPEGGNP